MVLPSDAFRRLNFVTLCSVLFSFCMLTAAHAGTLPADAPVLISEANSTRALFEVSTSGRSTPARIIQPGRNVVVTFFVTNLELLDGEGANAFRAEFEDSRHYRFPLQIVSFSPASKSVYALTVRVPQDIGNVGDVLVRVTWRGMSSNRVRVSIGSEGGKIADDPGSVPTPMPTQNVARRADEPNRVGLPWTGDRVRFMEQASFGPNAALELRLRRIGYSTWLEEQMDEQIYESYVYPHFPFFQINPSPTCDGDTLPPDSPVTCFRDNYTMYRLQNWFYKEALYNEQQQLRRRVSWALSQILVTSGRVNSQPTCD